MNNDWLDKITPNECTTPEVALALMKRALGLAEDATAEQCVARAKELRAALEPFAEMLEICLPREFETLPENTYIVLPKYGVQVGRIRRAAEALAATPAEPAAQQAPVPASGELPAPRRMMINPCGPYPKAEHEECPDCSGDGCVPVDTLKEGE